MASDFSVEAVKDCILERGGRIRNHELVTHFKSFLNDPVNKVPNREKFKDFVNELATIKVEEGQKVLVLKKKHRPESSISTSSSSSSIASNRASGDGVRAHSEPPEGQEGDRVDGGMMSKGFSDDNLEVRLKSSTRQDFGPGGQKKSFEASTPSLTSGGSQGSLSSPAEGVSGSGSDEGNVSVLSIKERVQHLNKITSETDLQQDQAPIPRRKLVKDRDDDDESHTSGGTSYVTLTPEEKEWMLVSSTADYHEMFRLLTKNSRLAKLKDLSNTALHWAAKFGKPEVVKMLANKIGVNVNQRSAVYMNQKSGYTPLHLAAIHGHEDIIELLVTVYKAEANIRDYSGRKAKQYLKNSVSSRAQQLLVSRKLGSDFGSSRSLDDSFTRSQSTRQSNRTRAISSLIQASSSVMRQPMLRSSWEGGEEDKTPGSTPPGSGTTSPACVRKYKDEKNLMPPPHTSSYRRRRVDRSKSSSRESLNSQSQSSSAMDKGPTNQVVPRSESDPALARKTFV